MRLAHTGSLGQSGGILLASFRKLKLATQTEPPEGEHSNLAVKVVKIIVL